MSLINETLKNLEKQNKGNPPNQNEVLKNLSSPRENKSPHHTTFVLSILLLLFAAGLSLFFFFFNKTIISFSFLKPKSIAPVTQKNSFKETKEPEKTLQKKETPDATLNETRPQITKPDLVKIKNISIKQNPQRTQLIVLFDKKPLYTSRLNHNHQEFFLILKNSKLHHPPSLNLEHSLIENMVFDKSGSETVIYMTLYPKTKVTSLLKKTTQYDDASFELVLSFTSTRPEPKPLLKKTPVPLSTEQKAEQQYQQALKSLKKNNVSTAIAELYSALKTLSSCAPARELLATLLIKKGSYVQASHILTIGLKQKPHALSLITLQAQSLSQQGQTRKAIRLLQSLTPQIYDHPDYYALTAALLQKQGEAMEAAKIYYQLVKYDSSRAIWWLGLAVSLEAADKNNAALEAYQHALRLPGLDQTLHNFVLHKTQVLM